MIEGGIKMMADEKSETKKWLAQFFVFSFWPALIIAVFLAALKIFGVQFSVTRWWDALFIPLICTAVIMTWKKLNGTYKISPAMTSFFMSIIIVGLAEKGKIMSNKPLGFYDLVAFSTIPILTTVIFIINGAIKKELSGKYLDSSFWFAGLIMWSVLSGYMFFSSIAFGSSNLDWFVLIVLAILITLFSMCSAIITAVIAYCVYGIIAVHKFAFVKPSKKE